MLLSSAASSHSSAVNNTHDQACFNNDDHLRRLTWVQATAAAERHLVGLDRLCTDHQACRRLAYALWLRVSRRISGGGRVVNYSPSSESDPQHVSDSLASTLVFHVELRCLLCGRDCGIVELARWPSLGPALLRTDNHSSVGASAISVRDWSRLRCRICGGNVYADEVMMYRIYPRVSWDDLDPPRRGRPPRRSVRSRRCNRTRRRLTPLEQVVHTVNTRYPSSRCVGCSRRLRSGNDSSQGSFSLITPEALVIVQAHVCAPCLRGDALEHPSSARRLALAIASNLLRWTETWRARHVRPGDDARGRAPRESPRYVDAARTA